MMHAGRLPLPTTINQFSAEVLGASGLVGAVALADATFPAANRAIFLPVQADMPALIRQLGIINGAAVSGNVDFGLYLPDGTRITSTGSTAMAGATAKQTVDITDVWLTVPLWYLAFACDNTTASFFRCASTAGHAQATGVKTMAAAFPLPATATFANAASGYLPSVFASQLTLI